VEQLKVLGLLVPLFLALALPSAGAQTIPTPVDDVADEVEDTAGQVVETVEDTADGATQTTQETAGSVTGSAGSATGSAGSVTGSAGGGSGGGTSGTPSVGGSVVSPTGSSTSGSSAQRGGDPASGSGERRGQGARGDKAGAKGASGRATIRPSAPARPEALAEGLAGTPVVVAKTNDADEDGSFSRVEIAPEPRADVAFRIVIRNVGSQPVTVLGLSDYLPGGGQVSVRREVCADLAGTTIDPGATVVCAFTLSGYAPPEGGVKVNTAAANVVVGDEMTGGGITRSLYATSSVQTGPTEVLGLVLPDPGALARTGAAVLPLLAAAIFFATVGAQLLRAGRVGLDPAGMRRYR
jgi:hypothetical protein